MKPVLFRSAAASRSSPSLRGRRLFLRLRCPPLNFSVLALVALTPVIAVAARSRWKFAALAGYAWGVGWSLFAFRFLREIDPVIPFLMPWVILLWPAAGRRACRSSGGTRSFRSRSNSTGTRRGSVFSPNRPHSGGSSSSPSARRRSTHSSSGPGHASSRGTTCRSPCGGIFRFFRSRRSPATTESCSSRPSSALRWPERR